MAKPRLASLIPLALSVLVVGPLLAPGYVLALDMVFAPHMPVPDADSSSFVFRWILYTLAGLMPTDFVQKVLLLAIFALMASGVVRLMAEFYGRQTMYVTLAVALVAVFYVLNPFTYGRLMTGQYSVLAGYAVLPWVLRSLMVFAWKPGWKPAITLSAWTLGVSIVSVHAVGVVIVAAVPVVAAALWRSRRDRRRLGDFVKYGLSAIAIVLVCSAYWLAPLLGANSAAGQAVRSFDAGDRQAYQTVGNGVVERAGNVLGIQGFWAERYGLFELPQETVGEEVWMMAISVLLVLVVYGGVVTWRLGRRMVVMYSVWCIGCGAALAAGAGSGWLSDNVPLFAGYREPQKFTMLVVLGYCLLLVPAVSSLAMSLARWPAGLWRRVGTAAVTALFLVVVLTLSPMMPLAGGGQLKAVQYPEGWKKVDRRISRDAPYGAKIVALPWHLYLHMDFADRVTANPVPTYFGHGGREVISSNDPEFGGSSVSPGTHDTWYVGQAVARALAEADAASAGIQFARAMAVQRVGYIILTKNTDFDRYSFVDTMPGWQQVYDDEDISLYRTVDR